MDMFPLLCGIPEAYPQVKITETVFQHLSQLAGKVEEYLPVDPREEHVWILHLFSVDPTKNDASYLESQLMEFFRDNTLRRQWDKLDLDSFRIAFSKEYPSLALRAVKLRPFKPHACVNQDSPLWQQHTKLTQSCTGGYCENDHAHHSTQTQFKAAQKSK